jgi:hypothetical protein
MTSRRWTKPLWLAVIMTAVTAGYVSVFKEFPAGRFFIELSNSMFLFGVSMFCFSLIYVTRFFGFLPHLKNMFGGGLLRKKATYEGDEADVGEEDSDPRSSEEQKRDPSLVYASLLVVLLSIPVFYI